MMTEHSPHSSSHTHLSDHHCVQLVPLFSTLTAEELAKVETVVHHHEVAKNEEIISPYSDPQLTIVAHGSLKIYQLSPSGREQLLRVIEPGGYEGEQSLFGVVNENLYGSALQDTTVCVLRKTDFTSLLLSHPELSLRLLQINAEKARDTENQARFLMMEEVEGRLASYLLDLYRASGSRYVELPMKMKDLATFIGTTPETLSRRMKTLEAKGFIERDGRMIKLRDVEELEDMI